VIDTPTPVKEVAPEFVTVTALAALVVPTVWLAKIKMVGLTVTAVPVPVNGIV
jgi:hypothetical protein